MRTQNLLTVAKVVGVSLVIVVAALAPGAAAAPVEAPSSEASLPPAIALALVCDLILCPVLLRTFFRDRKPAIAAASDAA